MARSNYQFQKRQKELAKKKKKEEKRQRKLTKNTVADEELHQEGEQDQSLSDKLEQPTS